MYAEILKRSFDPYFNAPLEAWSDFASLCESVRFEKNQTIKKADAVERYFYFILKGSAGLFLWKEHNFVCLDFAFDWQFCGDYMSLLTKAPTPLEVTALEQSEMLRISRENFYKLGTMPVGQIIFRISAESSFVEKQQQQIDLLTKSAAERYEILEARFPGISLRIAQKHIASYLGITPQSLSRLRRRRTLITKG